MSTRRSFVLPLAIGAVAAFLISGAVGLAMIYAFRPTAVVQNMYLAATDVIDIFVPSEQAADDGASSLNPLNRRSVLNAGQVVESSLLPFEVRSVFPENYGGLIGDGGGTAIYRNVVLLADRGGQMFIVRQSGEVELLQARVPLNWQAVKDRGYDDLSFNRLVVYTRVMDIHIQEIDDANIRFFASHHWWIDNGNPADLCKVTRVSVSATMNPREFLTGNIRLEPNDWTVVFQAEPCLGVESDQAGAVPNTNPVRSNRTGGQIVEVDGRIILSLGDVQLDSVANAEAAGQSDAFDYAKFIAIDPDTGESEHFATGTRNAQGLTVARGGTIYATEHGPQGGDELNVINDGANYGWPSVSYGTNYGTFSWPANERQGRHDGYAQPIFSWVPSIAPSGLIEIGSALPEWEGDLLVASLRAQTLFRIVLEGNRVVLVEPIPIGHRIRDVKLFDNGTLMLFTGDDILMLEPLQSAGSIIAGILPSMTDVDAQSLGGVLLECSSCHSFEPGQNGGAPTLHGVFGRDIGSTSFGYSEALRGMDRAWTRENLVAYLEDPEGFASGTTMPAVEFANRDQIRQLVDVLRSINE